MNEISDTPSSVAPPSKLRHLLSVTRSSMFLLASLFTVLALSWAVENWRGARAWSAAKRDLVARGEPLSIDQLLHKVPMDESNFAATPLLRGLLDYYPPGDPLRQQNAWRDPHILGRLRAISLPPTRTLRAPRPSELAAQDHDENGSDSRMDLMRYALGIRMRPQTCPPDLDPALAERYGFLAPGRKWKKPTNEVQIAASILDPAGEVLAYLQRFEPELQEIADAVRRPLSQFPVHWEEDYQALLPHLAPLKQFDVMFSVRAAARLRKQDIAGAFADATTCLRLANAMGSEPLPISQLVGIGLHGIAVKALWEGMAGRQWNADQFAAFQTELARFNFQKQMINAFRGDRIAQNSFLDKFNQRRMSVDAVASGDTQPGPLALVLPWVPGWIRQNQVRVNRYDDLALRQLTDARWPASLVGAPDQEALLRGAGIAQNTPYSLLGYMLVPDLPKAQTKAARGQTLNQLAMVGCALERFRLEHGGYPKGLSELTPRELPGTIQDPMAGAPLQYEPTSDQSAVNPAGFKLWSVGLDGRDDGGLPRNQENNARSDWVWPELVLERSPAL